MSENIKEIILSVKTGTVNPTTVTPDFVGQLYLNTTTDKLFFAKSATIGDYEEIIDINSTETNQAHDQNSDTKLDDGQPNEVTSADLRTHLDNLPKHREINDGSSTTTNLYSAEHIDSIISASTSNLDMKDSVVTVADTNIVLSGEQTINGFLTSSSRVGIVGQTASEENGIYITSAGAWTRTTDADTDEQVTNGLSFFVSNSGSTKNGNQYILITQDPIILDTTPLNFIEVPRIVLGTTSGTATEGNDPRVPTQDENDALIGTNGTPSTSNKYVTDQDTRLHTHSNKTELDLITDGDHDVRTDNPHNVDKTQVGLSNVTNDSQLKRSAGDLNSFPLKPIPDLADIVIIEDSADSFNKKKIDLSDIKGLVLSKARFFLPNTNTSGNKGNYLVATLGANASINLTFKIPSDFVTLASLELFYIVNSTVVAQNIDLTSDYALAGQILNFNTEVLLAEPFAGTIEVIETQDLTGVFTGLLPNHICGLTWKNNAIGTGLNILGIKLRYE